MNNILNFNQNPSYSISGNHIDEFIKKEKEKKGDNELRSILSTFLENWTVFPREFSVKLVIDDWHEPSTLGESTVHFYLSGLFIVTFKFIIETPACDKDHYSTSYAHTWM